MLEVHKAQWVNLAADGIVTPSPAYLICITLTVTDAGDYVDVYEGRDTTSGKKILRMKALANRSVSFNFTYPVYCDGGIYVDFSTDDSEATIAFISAADVEEQGS